MMTMTLEAYFERFVRAVNALEAAKEYGINDPTMAEAALEAAEDYARAKLLTDWEPETRH